MPDIFEVTIVSPVHIGSGVEYRRGVDFVVDGGKTHLLDPARIVEYGAASPAIADEIARGAKLEEILRRQRIDVSRLTRATIGSVVEADRIREAQRDADGRVLIPGSSIKGSLRTLLLTAWVARDAPHGKRSDAGAAAIAAALGAPEKRRSRTLDAAVFRNGKDDPKYDILRGLRVSDAHLGPDALVVSGSIAVGTSRNTLTACESLRPGVRTVIRIQLDAEPLIDCFGFDHRLPSWGRLVEWSRTHADHLLQKDLAFFQRHAADAVVERCRKVREAMRAASTDTLFLRLGWGTGWYTMTGDILEPGEIAALGKPDRPFRLGKTRKVVLDGCRRNSRPSDVFGWLSLRPIRAQAARALFVLPLKSEKPQSVPADAVRPSKPAKPAPSPFVQELAALRPADFGRIGGLVDAVKTASARQEIDAEERGRRLQAIATRCTELWGHNKRRMKKLREIKELAEFL